MIPVFKLAGNMHWKHCSSAGKPLLMSAELAASEFPASELKLQPNDQTENMSPSAVRCCFLWEPTQKSYIFSWCRLQRAVHDLDVFGTRVLWCLAVALSSQGSKQSILGDHIIWWMALYAMRFQVFPKKLKTYQMSDWIFPCLAEGLRSMSQRFGELFVPAY